MDGDLGRRLDLNGASALTDNQGGGGEQGGREAGRSRSKREEGGRKSRKKEKKEREKQEKGEGKGREQEKREGKRKETENKLENECFCDFRAGRLSQFGAGREPGRNFGTQGGNGAGRLPSKPPKAAEKKHHCWKGQKNAKENRVVYVQLWKGKNAKENSVAY